MLLLTTTCPLMVCSLVMEYIKLFAAQDMLWDYSIGDPHSALSVIQNSPTDTSQKRNGAYLDWCAATVILTRLESTMKARPSNNVRCAVPQERLPTCGNLGGSGTWRASCASNVLTARSRHTTRERPFVPCVAQRWALFDTIQSQNGILRASCAGSAGTLKRQILDSNIPDWPAIHMLYQYL